MTHKQKTVMKISYNKSGKAGTGDQLVGIDTGAVKSAEGKIAQYMAQLAALENQGPSAPLRLSNPADISKIAHAQARKDAKAAAILAKIAKQNDAINAQTKKSIKKKGGK